MLDIRQMSPCHIHRYRYIVGARNTLGQIIISYGRAHAILRIWFKGVGMRNEYNLKSFAYLVHPEYVAVALVKRTLAGYVDCVLPFTTLVLQVLSGIDMFKSTVPSSDSVEAHR
ncbi:hypothetical protein NP493_661g01035 [Ridgeia piscesae]|uniref:Uncharacterized protein n=1 Tax=Ridgeia piscesae TaxID=27915 RepID=A0AAD9KS26_RIDPI|nr:hypothetical protein NP493_661g01035 [Ridgeia piscesae]